MNFRKRTIFIGLLALLTFRSAAQDRTTQEIASAERPAIIAKLRANEFRDDASLLKALAEAHKSRLVLEIREELRSFAARNQGSQRATTAELWLAVTELRFANSKSAARRKENIDKTREALAKISESHPASWHAKAARFGMVACLMAAKEWAAFEEEANRILAGIGEFTKPAEEELGLFVSSLGLNPAEIECEIHASLMIAASSRGQLSKALEHAQTLQGRFPAWTQQNGIPQVIERLRKNESPYSLR